MKNLYYLIINVKEVIKKTETTPEIIRYVDKKFGIIGTSHDHATELGSKLGTFVSISQEFYPLSKDWQ